MQRIALLRCGKLPSFVTWDVPNLEELFEEDNLLRRGFEAGGFEAESVVWNRPAIDWSRFDAALIRSTWDYLDDRDHFLSILAEIEASSCALFNSLSAVRWNVDKRYLFDLSTWGVPIIPTYAAAGVEPADLRRVFAANGWHDVILKPTVGLGASYIQRVPLDDLDNALARLDDDPMRRRYLIQPYIPDIVTEGEWSFVYFNGRLSHTLLKQAAPGDYRIQGIYGGTIRAAEPTRQDRALSGAVMARLPFDPLYARIDFVRVNGRLSVIEVELVEPIFSFNLVTESIERLVEATRQRLAAA